MTVSPDWMRRCYEVDKTSEQALHHARFHAAPRAVIAGRCVEASLASDGATGMPERAARKCCRAFRRASSRTTRDISLLPEGSLPEGLLLPEGPLLAAAV